MGKYDSWLRLIVRAFAEPVVDNYNDEELYRIYHSKTRDEFIRFFNDQVEKVEDERLLVPHARKSWWTEEKIIALMRDAGFSKAEVKEQNVSNCGVFQNRRFNKTQPNISLFVEGTKQVIP